MNLHLQNKIALVTGASQGIGREIAIQLARNGVKLFLTSKDQLALEEVAQEIQELGGEVKFIVRDLQEETSIDAVANLALEHFDQVDILINNVGSIGRVGEFESFTREDWLDLINLNVLNAVMLAKLLIPGMKRKQHGRIIFIASEKASEPGSFLAPYAMTKAAIVSIAKTMANELGKNGITVNCISPGVILTPAWDADAKKADLSREEYAAQFCKNVISKEALGTPNDIANMVCYLCSDLARWITGSNIRVDGGAIESLQL